MNVMQLSFASSLSIARLINDELRIATILFVQWRIVPSTYAMIVALFDEFVTTSTRSSPEQTWKTSPQHDIWFCFVSDGIVTFLKSVIFKHSSNFDAWNVSIATVCQPTATSFSPANLFLTRLMLSKYHNFRLSNGFIHISVNFPQIIANCDHFKTNANSSRSQAISRIVAILVGQPYQC